MGGITFECEKGLMCILLMWLLFIVFMYLFCDAFTLFIILLIVEN